jgi:GTP-binding protein
MRLWASAAGQNRVEACKLLNDGKIEHAIVGTKPPPSIVLVGRPNVGKSTLFNRLTGTRRAIVTATPGTTRDVITYPVVWQELALEITDTGGMFGASQDPLHQLVVDRGRRALASADVVVFVVDGREGLVSGDEEIADAVRASSAPTVVAINKMDDRRSRDGALEFYRLGFDPVVQISAEHGDGVGDLLDEIVNIVPRNRRVAASAVAEEEAPHGPGTKHDVNRKQQAAETAVAIVGRPNAGKSSLVNRLLREERMIVSETPGTTRDTVDSILKWHRRTFRIVDTAGIRRPGKVAQSGQVEMVSVMLARRAIERADVVAVILDATAGVTDQDAAIAGAAHEAGRGIVLVANKWDLMKDGSAEVAKKFDEDLRYRLKFLDYAPILHISAATGERTPRLLETIDKVAGSRHTRVPTGELNRFIAQITAVQPPVSPGQRAVRVMYAAQTGVAPPTFVLFTNIATKLHFSYERYLENRLREAYGFYGTPIRIAVRKRGPSRSGARKR